MTKIRTIKDLNGIVIMYDLGLYSYKGIITPQLFPPQLSNKFVEITNKAIEYFNKTSNENPKITSYLEIEDCSLERNYFIIHFELYNEFIALIQPVRIQLIKINKNIDDFLVEQNFDIQELTNKINILTTENSNYKEEIKNLKNDILTANNKFKEEIDILKNDMLTLKSEIEKINQNKNNQQFNNLSQQSLPSTFTYNKPLQFNNQVTTTPSNTITNPTTSSSTFPTFNFPVNNPTTNQPTNSSTIPTFNFPVNNPTTSSINNQSTSSSTIPTFNFPVTNPTTSSINNQPTSSNNIPTIGSNNIPTFEKLTVSLGNNSVK